MNRWDIWMRLDAFFFFTRQSYINITPLYVADVMRRKHLKTFTQAIHSLLVNVTF